MIQKLEAQATIVTQYESHTINAKIRVVFSNTKNTRGLFREVKEEYKESFDEIARVGEDGIMYINKAHPVMQYYASSDLGEKSHPIWRYILMQ